MISMLSRSLLVFLLVVGASSHAQAPAATKKAPWSPDTMTSFRALDFDLTYSYPKDFIPADSKTPAPTVYALPKPDPNAKDPTCVHAPLSVGYTNGGGNSVLVFSIIDGSCPSILKDAQQLSTFTHAQILRQLKRYGVPTITKETTTYTIDGRPAAVTMASAHATETQRGDTLTMTYAAKACIFAEPQPYNSDRRLKEPPTPGRVLCFDFTTQQRDLLAQMFNFPVQFGHRQPHAVVPATVLAEK
jgi:hypothetical protein